MNGARRGGTPESDAVVSSEDERPWPSSTSFGSLPRKENGVPGLPGNIWSTSSQKRGSFLLSEAAQRNAAREARLGAPNQPSSLRTANTPSPSASEGATSLPFAIPLQPTQKPHRSLSHSQGQRDTSQPMSGRQGGPTSGDGATLPTSLLANLEEVETEPDSEMGGPLAQTVSHPPIGALQRASTYTPTYSRLSGLYNDDDDDYGGSGRGNGMSGRVEGAFANLSLEHPHRRAVWESNLGFGITPINESRRHSLADIPTRRNSFDDDDGDDNHNMGCWPSRPTPAKPRIGHPVLLATASSLTAPTPDDDLARPRDLANGRSDMRYNDDPNGQGFGIPASYRVPYVELRPQERPEGDRQRQQAQQQQQQQQSFPLAGNPRPRKLLYLVSFKCSRVDVFYLLDNTGLSVREGDLVIVEADRGQDLGTVQHANVTPDDARTLKRKYAEEQYKWLMMFSRNNNPNNTNPNARLLDNGASQNLFQNAPATMQGMPRENFNNLKPKAIKRLANAHEIKMLAEKEGNEAKAKRTCQQKVAHLHLQMEILDAEWQWDFQKLIFYYYADHYINFKDLITELYRIYKTRIWLSAVNPASFSQHAMGQPPSGIGPGAVGGYNGNFNNTYTMSYGPDPDPYGAIPPYQVGPYDNNYPGIPGITNSFPPNPDAQAGDGSNPFSPTVNMFQPATDPTNPLPTIQPGTVQNGTPTDYGFFYDRTASNGHDMRTLTEGTPNMLSSTSATSPGTDPHANPFLPPFWPGAYGAYPMASAGIAPSPLDTNFSSFAASPWNSTGSPINPAAAGLGRQTTIPQPIGTARPRSNGNASAPNTAGVVRLPQHLQQPQTDMNNDRPTQFRSGAPGTTAGISASSTATRTVAGGPWRPDFLPNVVNRNAEVGNWVRRQASETQNENAVMGRNGYADEMSRER